jgi:DNA-binding GntR family transcriptional regulator
VTQTGNERLAPVRPVTVSDRVAEEVRASIVSGRLQPGSRLVEEELARQLQVSRGPVREALRVLRDEGLVTIRPHRGAVVTDISAVDVYELYAVRGALGLIALRHVAGEIQAGGPARAAALARIDALDRKDLAALKRVAKADQARLVDGDLAFQAALIDLSGLRRVSTRFAELTTEIRAFVSALAVPFHDTEGLVTKHQRMLALLRSGDGAALEAAWREHIDTSRRELIAAMPASSDEDGVGPWMSDLF